jgi:hypothetical protein
VFAEWLVGLGAKSWQGERTLDTLTAGLDEQNTALIKRVLELIGR